jgi:putative colanic acid biosynthesis UDP-glucose lipid carrier transferase
MEGISVGGRLPESRNFKELGIIQQHGALLLRTVFLTDATLIYLTLRFSVGFFALRWDQRFIALTLLSVLVFGAVTSFGRLYRSWRIARLRDEIAEIFVLLSLTFAIVMFILAMETHWGSTYESRRLVAFWYGSSFLTIAVSRTAIRLCLRSYRATGHDHRTAAFVGVTQTSLDLIRIFQTHPWMGINVVGVYDDIMADDDGRQSALSAQVAGGVDRLLELVQDNKVNVIYITLPMEAARRVKEIVDRFADSTASIYYCPMLSDLGLLNARWDDIFGHPVVSIVASPFDGSKRYVKRIEDLVLALLIIPIILIPIAVLAVAIKLTSPGPVFYNQTRYGLGGRPFKIRKLRTMYTVDSDSEFVQAKKGDARITPLGSFMRRTSLDELPQFFNVLLGQMSVVGPRPAPVKYNETHRKIIHRYMVRHKIKPGITGLAQVSGYRGETDILEKTEQRTRYDLEYMNNWSIWLDLRILYKTVVLTLGDFRRR